MKLTKSKLKEIIAEELRLEAEEELPAAFAKGPVGSKGGEEEGEEGGKSKEELKPDVKKLYKRLKPHLPAIDTAEEYNQLLKIILKHPVKAGKGKALRNVKDLFMGGLEEK